MRKVLIGMMLLFVAMAAFGAVDAQGLINAGVEAKKAGDYVKAAGFFLQASQVAAPASKLRCVGLRCHIYSLTKAWSDANVVAGDASAEALAKEYAEDGDAQVARATWYNRHGFELVKAGKTADAIPMFEKSLAARQDFPVFANNYAVALCDLADAGTGGERKALAEKALRILAGYKSEGKLAETKARAEAILARTR